MLDGDAEFFTVTDLKQYIYCARVVFYERCLPDFRPRTYKMDAGHEAHEHQRKLSARRTLQKYGLIDGERHFDVALRSPMLGLTGVADEVIVTADPHAAYPVDYKLARQVSSHYRVQLAAYALMIEEIWNLEVPKGYVYLIPLRKLEAVPIGIVLRADIRTALTAMNAMVRDEKMPPPTQQRRKCINCEFRRVCNDV